MTLYVVPFEAQLGQKNGGALCTGVAAARAAVHAKKGTLNITGAQVRAQTDEPIPDPASPGLNLPQVQRALLHWGVGLEVRIGSRADLASIASSVTWQEYEERRIAGYGCILQVGYGPIADSPMDAGNGFRGGHAVFETLHGTYDSLADGRRSNVWKYDGRVYDRPLIEKAAAALPIPVKGKGGKEYTTHPKSGYVWAAFTVDVVPPYEAYVRPVPPAKSRKIAVYTEVDGRITSMKSTVTFGFTHPCSPPQYLRKPGGGYRELVRLDAGPRRGKWVWSGWARQK